MDTPLGKLRNRPEQMILSELSRFSCRALNGTLQFVASEKDRLCRKRISTRQVNTSLLDRLGGMEENIFPTDQVSLSLADLPVTSTRGSAPVSPVPCLIITGIEQLCTLETAVFGATFDALIAQLCLSHWKQKVPIYIKESLTAAGQVSGHYIWLANR